MKKGFTLIEIAIVIGIIGVISAAIAGGYHIITTSRLIAVISDVHKINRAVNQFYHNYQALPGDMADTSVLGIANVGGNGNGIIDNATEAVRFWYQLELAHLISGNFSPDVAYQYTIATDTKLGGAMASPFQNVGFSVNYNYPNGLMIDLSRYSTGENGLAALTPQQAYYLDSKYDDGNANTGMILASSGSNVASNACANSSGIYNLSNKAPACVMSFILETDFVINNTALATCSGGAPLATTRESETAACSVSTIGKIIETCTSSGWQNTQYHCSPVTCDGGYFYNEIRYVNCPTGYVANSANAACISQFGSSSQVQAVIVQQCGAAGIFKEIANCCLPSTEVCDNRNSIRHLACPIGYGGEALIQQCLNAGASWQWTNLNPASGTGAACQINYQCSGGLNIGDYDPTNRTNCNSGSSIYNPSSPTASEGVMQACTIPTSGTVGNLMISYNNCMPSYSGSCTSGESRDIGCPVGEIGHFWQECASGGYWQDASDPSILNGNNGVANSCQPVTCGGSPLGSYRINYRESCPNYTIGQVLEICVFDAASNTASWQISYANCAALYCPSGSTTGANWNMTNADTMANASAYASGYNYPQAPSSQHWTLDKVTLETGQPAARYCGVEGKWSPPDIPAVMSCNSYSLNNTVWSLSPAHDMLNRVYYIIPNGIEQSGATFPPLYYCKNGLSGELHDYRTSQYIGMICPPTANGSWGAINYYLDELHGTTAPVAPQTNPADCIYCPAPGAC